MWFKRSPSEKVKHILEEVVRICFVFSPAKVPQNHMDLMDNMDVKK